MTANVRHGSMAMNIHIPEPCPFCGYKADSDYEIMLHMETFHAEGQSPFVISDEASIAAMIALSQQDSSEYVTCQMEGCGEAILLTELDDHMELHDAEDDDGIPNAIGEPETSSLEPKCSDSFNAIPSAASSNLAHHVHTSSSSSDRHIIAKAAWKDILKMPEPSTKPVLTNIASIDKKRLGKAELGPHANEKHMPGWLVTLLHNDGATKSEKVINSDGKVEVVHVPTNHVPGMIPVISQLLDIDSKTSCAYLCDPNVKHVFKLKREVFSGGFCGYRNIQMLCSYIIDARSQGYGNFKGKIPTIFDIQEYIEHAWDIGINTAGRLETGGIKGTRKYIGTPDAQAMFCSFGISCNALAIRSKPNTTESYLRLFDLVEDYFKIACTDFRAKVRCTPTPPIYYQQPGHSMTIIGFEKKIDGTKNLLVFDPMFHDHSQMLKLSGRKITSHKAPGDRLKAYRRGAKYLKRYKEFEILKLIPPGSKGPTEAPAKQ